MQEGDDVDSNRQRGEADGERRAAEGRGGLGAAAFAHLVTTRPRRGWLPRGRDCDWQRSLSLRSNPFRTGAATREFRWLQVGITHGHWHEPPETLFASSSASCRSVGSWLVERRAAAAWATRALRARWRVVRITLQVWCTFWHGCGRSGVESARSLFAPSSFAPHTPHSPPPPAPGPV